MTSTDRHAQGKDQQYLESHHSGQFIPAHKRGIEQPGSRSVSPSWRYHGDTRIANLEDDLARIDFSKGHSRMSDKSSRQRSTSTNNDERQTSGPSNPPSRYISIKTPYHHHHSMSSTNTTASSSSPTPLSQSSRPATPQVLETSIVEKDIDPETGNKLINNYEILGEIGRGVHGKVKLARDIDTAEFVAIKIVVKQSRRRLGKVDNDGDENKVRREIAIMKKCVHPHVVRLKEVMDDPMSKKLYLVLEYMQGGEIIWRTPDVKPALTIEQSRRVFRDVVLGLEYLHFNGIIHRDIKPANLLLTQSHSVKISDFGVSHVSAQNPSGEEIDLDLAKTAGSPAFFAPELCWTISNKPRPPVTPAIDIWALGVTLYCLLYARLPFSGSNEFVLFKHICETPLSIPHTPSQASDTLNLLKRLLKKMPNDRITLPEIKRHPFTLHGLPNPTEWIESTDPRRQGDALDATPDEIAGAFSIVDRLKRKLWKLGVGLGLGNLVGVGASVRRRATTSRVQPPGHSSARTAPVTPAVAEAPSHSHQLQLGSSYRQSMYDSPARRGSDSSRGSEADPSKLNVAMLPPPGASSSRSIKSSDAAIDTGDTYFSSVSNTITAQSSPIRSPVSFYHKRPAPVSRPASSSSATHGGLPRLRAMSDLSSSNLLLSRDSESFKIPRASSSLFEDEGQQGESLMMTPSHSQEVIVSVEESTPESDKDISRQGISTPSRLNIPRKSHESSSSGTQNNEEDDDGFYIHTDKPRGRV